METTGPSQPEGRDEQTPQETPETQAARNEQADAQAEEQARETVEPVEAQPAPLAAQPEPADAPAPSDAADRPTRPERAVTPPSSGAAERPAAPVPSAASEAPTHSAAPERAPANGRLTPVENLAELSEAYAGEDLRPARARFTPEQAAVYEAGSKRRFRRRRRYSFYLRRALRDRRTQRAAIITRTAWALVALTLLVIVSTLTTSFVAADSYYQSNAGLIKNLQHHVASQDSVRIYDSKGTLLYEFSNNGSQHTITLSHIPINVVNATTAIEDKDFWVNDGVDFTATARAALTDLQHQGNVQGGSTITQQLMKAQLLQNTDKDYSRKLSEAILAIGITQQGAYTKTQILELYLNSIGYGHEAYGIDAAAHTYFGYNDDPATGMTAAQHLDLAQASLLAGVPQNPNKNDPIANFATAHARQRIVLNNMVSYGYITRQQADAAFKETEKPNFFNLQTAEQKLAPHFVNYVIDQLTKMLNSGQLDSNKIGRNGLDVYTTLDLDLTNHAEQAIKDHLYGNDENGYHTGLVRDSNLTNAAVLIADHHTGAIKVYQGSADYYSTTLPNGPGLPPGGQFDVLSQGRRGPGSSFKPIVYATAFEKGWFPAFPVSDEPTVFWDAGENKPYKPLDFTIGEFKGQVTVRTALQYSLNIPAVKAMQFSGIDDVKAQAERMGITNYGGTWGLASVLGALDIAPIEMVQAYTVFANYGQYIPLYAIDHIVDATGNTLFQYHTPQPVQVMSPQIAFLISSILSDNPARAGDFGGCSPLYLDPSVDDCNAHHFDSPNAWPAAAKTGTGQDFTDDWTLGYTHDYTGGVWAGNNDHTSMRGIDGITGAAPIWYHSMLYAEQRDNLPKTPFAVPSGVQKAHYSSNGISTDDYFLAGALPPTGIGNQDPSNGICFTGPDQKDWNICGSKQDNSKK